MADLRNSSIRYKSLCLPGDLSELSTENLNGFRAFQRAGLGEEVLPGFFILDKNLAIAVVALKVIPDPWFMCRELQFITEVSENGAIRVNEAVAEVSALLKRIEQSVDIGREVLRVPEKDVVVTNLLTSVLSELPQFKKSAQHIEEAINYVAQAGNWFVVAGGTWQKATLCASLLSEIQRSGPIADYGIKKAFECVRSMLERSPDVMEVLKREEIIPDEMKLGDESSFLGRLFGGSQCTHNERLHAWARTKMPLSEEFKSVDNDGTFVAVLTAHWGLLNGEIPAGRSIFDQMLALNVMGTKIANIASSMSEASQAWAARLN